MAGLSIGATGWAVRGRASRVFASSRWRGTRSRRSIALTFDDGPSPSTPRVLEILARYGVKATFFSVGRHAERRPAVVREIAAGGHEIGNHSYSHPLCALRRPSFIDEEFANAQDAIANATGRRPAWLRAPYGVRWFGFREMQARLGLDAVMWSIIGLDWKLPEQAIARRVLSKAGSGDIICLHDGRARVADPDIAPTLGALRRIVPALIDAGYHFETVSEILCPPAYPLKRN